MPILFKFSDQGDRYDRFVVKPDAD